MKKINVLFWIVFVSIFLASCGKEEFKNNSDATTNPDIIYSTAIQEFNFDVDVKGDILSFESLESFLEALNKLSGTSNFYYTEEAILNWQEKMGFNSMGAAFQKIKNKFDKVESDEDLAKFNSEFPNITFNQNEDTDEITLPVENENLAFLISPIGEVIINNQLHVFTGDYQIIIVDQDKNKLELALSTLVSDESNGVFVRKYSSDSVTSASETTAAIRSCSCGKSHNGQQQSGSKKVVGEIKLQTYASVIWYTSSNYYWLASVQLYYKGKSEKKNWRGKWKSYSTWMSYKAEWDVCSNMGPNAIGSWNEYPSSPTSSKTYTEVLYPVQYFASSNPPTINNPSRKFNSYRLFVKNVNNNITLDHNCN